LILELHLERFKEIGVITFLEKALRFGQNENKNKQIAFARINKEKACNKKRALN
jgi:hypothetical protein